MVGRRCDGMPGYRAGLAPGLRAGLNPGRCSCLAPSPGHVQRARTGSPDRGGRTFGRLYISRYPVRNVPSPLPGQSPNPKSTLEGGVGHIYSSQSQVPQPDHRDNRCHEKNMQLMDVFAFLLLAAQASPGDRPKRPPLDPGLQPTARSVPDVLGFTWQACRF